MNNPKFLSILLLLSASQVIIAAEVGRPKECSKFERCSVEDVRARAAIRANISPEARQAADELLILGAQIGDVVKVREALSKGAAPNLRDSKGKIPLMYNLARKPNIAVVRELLYARTDVNIADIDSDSSPIIWAAISEKPEIIDLLLAAGADVTKRSKTGWTALMATDRHKSTVIAKKLLAAGATLDKPVAATAMHAEYKGDIASRARIELEEEKRAGTDTAGRAKI